MLSRVIRKEPPSESFIWPVDLALHQGHPSFGYITPSRDVRFRSFGELLSRRVDPTFHALTTAGLCLADAFMRLHIAGFCHSRISLQNLFLDPHTGEISLSENDDLVPDGEPWHGGIGAPRFLAPELIRGKTGPSVATDHHTLAVLLFLMLMVHHPLEGRQESEIHCFDLEARRKVYGSQPLFIFDAKNLSNRPVPGLQDNALLFWNFYPAYVRDIFHRAFTDGLRDPQSRVGENEWRSLFIRMRDQIYYCDSCGAESFLSDGGNSPGPPPAQDCWACHQPLPAPLRIRLVHHAVILNQDTVLYSHHLDAGRRHDFSQIMAEMSPHPTRSDIWGLKNVSATTWTGISPNGKSISIPSGKSLSLIPGVRIRFGNVEGTVL
jgi:serine/threonine protein kinase